jgi:hypothetical protein
VSDHYREQQRILKHEMERLLEKGKEFMDAMTPEEKEKAVADYEESIKPPARIEKPNIDGPRTIESLRHLVFWGCQTAFDECDHGGKSYEGKVEVVYPSYNDYMSKHDEWAVKLHLYVFGPNRHYEWRAATLDEAVSKAYEEVLSWIRGEGWA